MSFKKVLNEQLKEFPPAYFSLPMATGILAIGANMLKLQAVDDILFYLSIAIYGVLIPVYLFRLAKFPARMKMELSMHMKGPGFLTLVIASCIVGIGCIQIKSEYFFAQVLLGIGFFFWLVILYSLLLGTSLKTDKPPPRKAVSGTWLLLVVSTQTLVTLTALVQKKIPELLTISLILWLLGFLLYIVLVSLVLYRLIFLPVKPEKISPSFWLDAGAAASIALAGITILNVVPDTHNIIEYKSIIELFSLLGWSAASWWLILLVFQEVWRHSKAGFSYSVGYWSLVFPIGIYAVASLKVSKKMQLPVLNAVGDFFYYVGLILWVVILIFMCIHLFKLFKKG